MSLSMVVEALILVVLILVFLASFCGLLRKIRNTYEQERTNSENTQQVGQTNNASDDLEGGIFPGSPPPYNEYYMDPPPKYEEVIKAQRQQQKDDQKKSESIQKINTPLIAIHKITNEIPKV